MFNKLYKAYKDTFDMELWLKHSKKTYSELEKEARKKEEWF